MAAPSTLCIRSIDSYTTKSLNPYEKAKVELYLADKYPDYYKMIKEMPCFEQELNKMYNLIHRTLDEIFFNDDISLAALDLWFELSDSDDKINTLTSEPISRNKLETLLAQEYPEYSKNLEQGISNRPIVERIFYRN